MTQLAATASEMQRTFLQILQRLTLLRTFWRTLPGLISSSVVSPWLIHLRLKRHEPLREVGEYKRKFLSGLPFVFANAKN